MTETTDSRSTGPGRSGDGAETGLLGRPDDGIPTRLLVLGLAHDDGRVHGPELYRVAQQCNISIETVRSCMRRLVNEGLFERTGEGREAVFAATEEGKAALGVTAARHVLAYAQDAAGRGWDRRWRLAQFAIPESRRIDRDRLRNHLITLGGAQLQPGIYVSPHRWESEVLDDAERLGIAGYLTQLSTDDLNIGGITDPREIARRLWDLDEVSARYTEFIHTYEGVPTELERMRERKEMLSESDFLPGVLHIAIRFNDCFVADPLLPPELLPKPWPGRSARELLAKCRRIGVMARSDKTGPALFQVFDDAIAHLP